LALNQNSSTYRHVAKGLCPCGVEHAPADAAPKGKKRQGEFDRSYQYIDQSGKLRHETVRFKNPKGFAQRHPGPDGKPIWSTKGVAMILYRLPELLAADPANVVWLNEGEKSVERMRSLGENATCSPMGAGKWRLRYSQTLRGRHVVIIPDNDDAGRAHAHDAAYSLQGVAASVKIVELPGLPEKGDVSDFLDAGGTLDQLRELASAAPEWVAPSQVSAAANSGSQVGAKPEPETHSEILLRLAAVATLFHDDSGRAFATVPVDNHTETHDLLGTGFRRWLKQQFYAAQKRPPSAQSVQDSLGVLEARAHYEGTMEQVFVRVAEHRERIYLDIGDDTWRAVEIDATGWRIVARPPVRFRRPSGFRPLPVPICGGSIDTLKQFANLDENDFLLLIAVMAAALRPVGPYPIVVLIGEHGTAKSTLAKIFRLLIDPHAVLLRGDPREPRDLMIGAVNNWIVAMDNLSSLPSWLSDSFCRLATGGGHATRTLYTNDEETFFDAQRPVILCGITDFVTRGDLVDRSVFLHPPVITDSARRIETKFFNDFHKQAPKLLGALLDAVAGGVRVLPNINLASIPRMADFAVFGEAVSRGLGNPPGKFLEAYRSNRKAATESVLEDSHVAAAIRELVAKAKWSGTSSELKDELELIVSKKIADSDRWPKSPRGMSGALRRLAPALRAVGVCVDFGRGHDRYIEIQRVIVAESGGGYRRNRRNRRNALICSPKRASVHASVEITNRRNRRKPTQQPTQRNQLAPIGLHKTATVATVATVKSLPFLPAASCGLKTDHEELTCDAIGPGQSRSRPRKARTRTTCRSTSATTLLRSNASGGASKSVLRPCKPPVARRKRRDDMDQDQSTSARVATVGATPRESR